MAFSVNFGKPNLLKSVNLLRSKGDFSGKSGRIASPGSEPNLHGCSRTLGATVAELKLAPRDPNRCKPAKTGLEMQKAENVHSRLSVLTG
jgi:hypothetical protein